MLFRSMANLLRIEAIRKLVLIAGACVLIYFGISYFLKSGDAIDSVKMEGRNSFLHGIKLTMTNPLTIIFWSGMFGSLIASGTLAGAGNILFYSLGCISSTILFLSMVSIGGKYASKLLNQRFIRVMSYGVGLFLIFFGGSM